MTLHFQFLKKLDYLKQLSSKNIPFYILIFEEILTEDNEYKNLIDILEKNNLHSAKVSMTTNGKSKYLTHPLTNMAYVGKNETKTKYNT